MQIHVINHSFHSFSVINITNLFVFHFYIWVVLEKNIIRIRWVIHFVIHLIWKSGFALCRLLFCLTFFSYSSSCIFSQIVRGKRRIIFNNSMQLIAESRYMHYFKGPHWLNKFSNKPLLSSALSHCSLVLCWSSVLRPQPDPVQNICSLWKGENWSKIKEFQSTFWTLLKALFFSPEMNTLCVQKNFF